MTRMKILLLTAAVVALSACHRSSSRPHHINHLYVAGGNTSSIAVWDDASTATGDLAPSRLVSGGTTTIDRPFGITYDSRSDTIVLGNWETSEVLFFTDASSMDGDVAPARTLSSADFDGVLDVALDEGRDILYVSGGHGIAVFENASTVDGDVDADRLLPSQGSTMLSDGGDLRLALDVTNDRVYVADPDADVPHIAVFDAISTRDGDVAPDRDIAGDTTAFDFNWGLAVDVSRDLLYVGDQDTGAVTVFESAGTLDGNVAPSRTIAGASTTMVGLSNVFVDEKRDTIFVSDADGDQILVFEHASTADGDIAPDRAIVGASTGLGIPGSLVGVK